ncbi:hypothetical protein GKE82_07160 [Conexibacter sp. W3-3-2]|uniref:FAD:protein FMN transferase n=1 Tax=Conexibacter sp. W3-3-2 TaxID=2675227 RepID=UPI0012B8A02C|nr:FAD:protein FMN transferase [Conexibacter sp. W3-3-2]MTD44087.1 hypothetical protein [Conexibacter sp. W3-3-2]
MSDVWESLTVPTMGTRLTLVGGAQDRPRAGVAARLRAVADELDLLAARWTRFDPASDLERLNDDPRDTVPVHPLLGRAIAAALWCRERSGGLVDPTLGAQLRAAGYDRSFAQLHAADGRDATTTARAGGPRPGRPHVTVTADHRAVTRPPGVRIDLGGTAKGLAADLAARRLRDLDRYAVDLGGDVRVGGTRRDLPQQVLVAGPEPDAPAVARLTVDRGAVATSTIVRRAWRAADGTVAHHLLDPRTGAPADTGVVQATARARTALEAELLAKQALLEGPAAGAALLRAHRGGVLVLSDRNVLEIPA